MKILILLKSEADETLQAIIEQQKKKSTIQWVNLHKVKDFNQLVEDIEVSDVVFTW